MSQLHPGAATGGRELLTADRDYYIDPAGDDNNTGLTVGDPFLTIQKGVDVASSLDFGIYSVNINLANGTYSLSSPVSFKNIVGGGRLNIIGDAVTPGNVVIQNSTPGSLFGLSQISATVRFDGMRLVIPGAVPGTNSIVAIGKKVTVQYRNIDFADSSVHIVNDGADVTAIGNYEISATAERHIWVLRNGRMNTDFVTVTLTGTPFWSSVFCRVEAVSSYTAGAMTFTGSATGKRFEIEQNGVVSNTGGGATYFPGNVAGTTATGGQYL